MKASNIIWHKSKIVKEERQKLVGHRSVVLWFTGLSGAGKSTLCVEVERELHKRRILTYILDGDNVRQGINKNLGFSPEDRKENIRRIGEISKLMVDAGIVTLCAFISPYCKDRKIVRQLFNEEEFIEIYVKCSLIECEKRDPKKLYKKARSGEIIGFTGIDAPYEEPVNPDIIVETDKQSLEKSLQQVIDYLEQKQYINFKYTDYSI
ncbi:adenylyl-sulfate kinase [Chengkuizengella axinellae]|uniref:Adenylyl-sulfate kinase n=1 Tax=Chengkuizengella axinellae TaxID=3064388 RepID=A0ABT9J687_9BACL|nr:adenylyl-sulfate kinase [Chengkuizengella sp. 2205SS18-9]MDP5277115.1 adenylyl-sulfate kinase [Chengkuizengella sp. 2205SS18-9]